MLWLRLSPKPTEKNTHKKTAFAGLLWQLIDCQIAFTVCCGSIRLAETTGPKCLRFAVAQLKSGQIRFVRVDAANHITSDFFFSQNRPGPLQSGAKSSSRSPFSPWTNCSQGNKIQLCVKGLRQTCSDKFKIYKKVAVSTVGQSCDQIWAMIVTDPPLPSLSVNNSGQCAQAWRPRSRDLVHLRSFTTCPHKASEEVQDGSSLGVRPLLDDVFSCTKLRIVL